MSGKGNGILSVFKKLYGIFSLKQRGAFNRLIALTFLGSVTDLLGLGLLIPVVGLVLSDEFYEKLVTGYPAIAGYSKEQLLLYAVSIFFILIIAKNIFSLYISRRQVGFVQGVYKYASQNLIDNIYARTLTDIQRKGSQEVVNIVAYLPQALCTSAILPMLIIFNEAIILGLTVAFVAVWNWQLLLLLLVVLLPSFGVFYSRVKDTIKQNGAERNKSIVRLKEYVQEMVYGYTDIKVAGTEQHFKEQLKKQVHDYSNYQRRNDLLVFVPARIIEMCIFICAVTVLLYGVYVLKDTAKIITTVSLFSVIAYRITPSVNRIANALHNINSTRFILQDEQFLKDIASYEATRHLPLSFHHHILFDGVSFAYGSNEKEVLKDCSVTIKKGEKLGIIGSSGAGKSTLIKLLLAYLQPVKGKVLIDETELTPLTMQAWWQLLGYVRQDVFIMNASLAENIALGVPAAEINNERLQHALRVSCLNELAATKTEGVRMMLGEGGNNLSGGQRQRIAIARAIYKGAEVLVFDEATSALDTQTEEEINRSIQNLSTENLTVIVIAHRYTSLKYCDRILKLENGMISQTYTYEELSRL